MLQCLCLQDTPPEIGQ